MGRLDRPLRRTRATPVYTIGAASRLTGIPIWTLRWIEKNGLLDPDRSRGRHRLYSDLEMDALREIRALMERKVNLAGIRVILGIRAAAKTSVRPR